MKKLIAIAALAVAALAAPVQAQSLKVATGGATGTYSKMLKEIQQSCGNTIAVAEQNTSGSVENVGLLTGNQVNAGFVQTDVLHFIGRNSDLSGIKTLVALHPEEVHVIALTTSLTKEGGTLGIGKKPIDITGLDSLANRRIGAWGGSVSTAQMFRLFTEVPFQLVEFPNDKDAKAALDTGNIEAIIAVGGAPLGFAAALDSSYKLVPLSEAIQKRLSGAYRPARLSYNKLSNSMGVSTVATDALFVTREYKTAKFTQGLSALRACILANLDELKETTGTHPKWQAVDGGNKGKWPYYELTPAAAVVSVVKKK